MAQLIIFRHGESLWNLENRFTGWADVGLTEKGVREAEEAGEKLRNITLNVGYASALKRTQQTLLIALKKADQERIPVVFTEALNERKYGDLQGLNKTEAAEKYGADTVAEWRRGYSIAPPNGESLKDTQVRAVAYFKNTIAQILKENKNVLIVTHGNTMRALVMHFENSSPEETAKLEFRTGEMRCYEFDTQLNIIKINNL